MQCNVAPLNWCQTEKINFKIYFCTGAKIRLASKRGGTWLENVTLLRAHDIFWVPCKEKKKFE